MGKKVICFDKCKSHVVVFVSDLFVTRSYTYKLHDISRGNKLLGSNKLF